jgi:hypothetical protein
MSQQQLAIADVRRAIDIYVSHAFPSAVPAAARAKIDALADVAEEELLSAAVFERDKFPSTSKFSLRLGNCFYPHMKLTIERSPDGSGYLFRADTHDRHCAPAPASREYAAFMQLMEQNQAIAMAIETAWAEAGLQTFKTYLRDDLARRRAASGRA